MAQSTFSTKAGALDGLELGAPLGGAGSAAHSTGTSNVAGSQIPESSQGIHHVGKFGLQDDSIGSTGSGLTEKVTHHHGHSGAHSHESHSHHSHSHAQGESETVGGLNPGVAAVMGPGHHDANPLDAGNTSTTTSSHPIADKYSHTNFNNDAALGAGVAGAGLGGTALRSDYHGDSSKTGAVGGELSGHSKGLNEFSDKGLVTPAGTGAGNEKITPSTGLATGGLTAGAGAAVVASQLDPTGTGVPKGVSSTSGSAAVDPNDPLAAIKQELKDNQKSSTHSSHDIESKGPHGLVWSDKDDKYVHQRELDGHGSTGVPLQ